MRVLLLHTHFPGHYAHIAPALAADRTNRVVFATRDPAARMDGVEVRSFAPASSSPVPVSATAHHLNGRNLSSASRRRRHP